VKREAEEDWGN
jgi:hypothetical protein